MHDRKKGQTFFLKAPLTFQFKYFWPLSRISIFVTCLSDIKCSWYPVTNRYSFALWRLTSQASLVSTLYGLNWKIEPPTLCALSSFYNMQQHKYGTKYFINSWCSNWHECQHCDHSWFLKHQTYLGNKWGEGQGNCYKLFVSIWLVLAVLDSSNCFMSYNCSRLD